MMCKGAYSCEADVQINVKGGDGTVCVGIYVAVWDRVGCRDRSLVHSDRWTSAQARAVARELTRLVYGDIGDFELAGLSFEAGEYSGVEIRLPHGRTVWLAEDANALALAERLDREAGE